MAWNPVSSPQSSCSRHWVSWGTEKGGSSFRELFRDAASTTVQSNVIPVILPMYNEEANELVSSLLSIQQMAQALRETHTVKVCIIQDGYQKLSATALQAFRAMFPPELCMNWESTLAGAADRGETLTCVLQAPEEIFLDSLHRQEILGSDWSRAGEDLIGKTLDVTLILKADNRKKYNSHDIFFRGFAAHHNSEFVLCTDCGTLFAKDCLQQLVTRMTREKDCIAVTGRQRTMTKYQQADCATEGLMGYIMRSVQSYENEFSTFLLNACFSVLGCLFVIPGPCGLFRLQPLLENTMEDGTQSPMDFYLQAAHRAEESEGMLDGNCILAEDRVLTYAALYLTRGRWKARDEKQAVYYFQSETSLGALVSQRRRWLNGTVAGFLYAHKELAAWSRPSSHSCMRIFMVRTCIKLMLLLYAGIAIMPALMINCLCYSLHYLKGESGGDDTDRDLTIWIVFTTIYFTAFVLFAVGHHSSKYDGRLFALCGSLNALAMFIIFYGLVVQTLVAAQWVQWAALIFVIAPVLMNLFIPDFVGLTTLLDPRTFFIYFCFMPTMQGHFVTLSIARSFDLSWGNRGGIGEEREALKKKSEAMMVIQIVLNFILVALPIIIDDVSMHQVNAGIMIFLLVPQGFIWFFSMVHCLGCLLFSVGLTLIGGLVFFRLMVNGYVLPDIGREIYDNAYFVTQFQTPVLFLALMAVPAVLKWMYCCCFSMVVRCCTVGQRAVRVKSVHADAGKFDVKHGHSVVEALTECLA